MTGNNKSSEGRHRLVLVIILCGISLLAWAGLTGIPGLEITGILGSLIAVILAGLWFGRNGIWAAFLLAIVLLSIDYGRTGSVSQLAIGSASLLLVAGVIPALLSERVRVQKEKEASLMAGHPDLSCREISDIGSAFGLARYCLLPHLNVRRMRERDDVRGLIRALTSDDVAIQYEATQALGEIADPSAVVPLIQVLSLDRYSAVRWKASEALAKIGEPAVVPLINELENQNDDVRWKAAIALGDIGDPRAIEPLVRLLGDSDPYVRGRVSYALSKTGQPAVPALIRVVSDGPADARPAAVSALGRINDPLAIAPLIRALGDGDDRVRSEALVALERAESNVLDRFLVILSQAGYREPGMNVTGNLNGSGKAVEPAPEIFSLSEEELRDNLVKALENTGDPAFEPLIRDILSGLLKR